MIYNMNKEKLMGRTKKLVIYNRNFLYFFLSISLLLIFLTSCISEKEKEILVESTDSLGWQEAEEYNFTNPIELKIIDNLLYVVDMALSEIKVFNPKTMKYISTLGKKGLGPGEFSNPLSICKYEKDALAVNEIGNKRTQILSPQGEYINKIDFSGQWKLSAIDEHCFTNKLPIIPDIAGIYEIKSDSLIKVFDIAEWLEDQSLPTFPKNFFSFSSLEKVHLVSFTYSPKILMIDRQGKTVDVEFEKFEYMYDNQFLGQPQKFKEGFIIPAFSQNSDDNLKTDTKLIYYNFDGLIENIYHIRDKKRFVFETMAIKGNEVFLISEGVIYKYVLE